MKSISLLLPIALLGLQPARLHSQENEELSAGHPRASYRGYTEQETSIMAGAIRKSRPQMHRGGWEWDRLLSRYIDSGRKDPNELKMLHAYFLSILDRNHEAQQAGDTLTLFYNHRSWGSGGRMRIYAELVRQKMLTDKQQADFKQLVLRSLKLDFEDYAQLERGVNNRPYGINSGPAIAVKMFASEPAAIRHKPWLDALWRELIEYGDTTETNYYPYGPLYLHGLLDMAEGMDKFESDREFLHAHARRYLDYIHGGGVRGNPNSGAQVIHDREKIYADPWNAEYYAGAEGVNDGHVWYRLAKHFKDPEFLWASEQVLLGGRPPEGRKVPAKYLQAYQQRYGWFIERGIQPNVPTGKSKIGYYSPLKYKVPERLYLSPGRESGKPFASFYLYDRNNNYMHCCGDGQGRLYEYCVDGAKLLHSSGKYSSGRASIGGPVGYDILNVLPPGMPFPVTPEGRVGGAPEDRWKMASLSLPFCLNCRTADDSENWKFDEQIDKFRRPDDSSLGFAYGNMDGYWYLNNDFHLKSVRLGPFNTTATVENVRLGGPKGEVKLASFDSIPKNMKVIIHDEQQSKTLTLEEQQQFLTVVQGRLGGSALQVNVPPSTSLSLMFDNLDRKFDANDDFTRVSFDYTGTGATIHVNDRTRPIYHTPLVNRGGILERDSLRAENHGDDSFGQFTYRNYFGAHSRWTRQTVLTAEGYLVVRDVYLPGSDVNGYQAAPCWMLRGEGEVQSHGQNWFDAPAWDHAWWQDQKKRVLVYQHPGEGLTFGQSSHRSSADVSSNPIHNTFAKATVHAGRPQVWLSVLVPFNEGKTASDVAQQIQTTIDQEGRATSRVGNISISINANGIWSVNR